MDVRTTHPDGDSPTSSSVDCEGFVLYAPVDCFNVKVECGPRLSKDALAHEMVGNHPEPVR